MPSFRITLAMVFRRNQPGPTNSEREIGRVFPSPTSAGACKKPTSWGSSAEDFHHRNDTGNQPGKVDGIVQKLGNLTQQVGRGVLDMLKETADTEESEQNMFSHCLMSFPFDRCGLSSFDYVSSKASHELPLDATSSRWRPCAPAEPAVLVKVCLWS